MQTASKVVADAVRRRGITIAELARRVDMHPELLRRSLQGDRRMTADEFVPLCVELDLHLEDFGGAE